MSTPNDQPGPNPLQGNPQGYGQRQYGQGQYGQGQYGQGQENPGQYGQQRYGQGYDEARSPYPAYPGPGGYAPGNGTLDYLNGAGVGFAQAVKDGMGNIITWRGRASRSAYWWFTLFDVVVSAVIAIIYQGSAAAGIILSVLAGIPIALAGLALTIRRLHDTNRAGWWWWIDLIPFVGPVVLLVFMLLPGTPGPNRHNTAQ